MPVITLKQVFAAAALAAGLGVGIAAHAEDAKPAPAAPPPAAKPADDKKPGSGPNPWADCGIGAALFTETKWAAVISNVIWDLGTTAVTSATASPQTCSGKQVVAAVFIDRTYANLSEESALGRGEHLTTVLNLFGCDSAHHAQASARIRSAMGDAVAAPGYVDQTHVQKASAFYSIVQDSVHTSCSI